MLQLVLMARIKTIEDMCAIAAEKGGKCLSRKYTNVKTRLRWQCSEGHEWEATPSNIIHRKSWCPYCVHNAPVTIKDARERAKRHGGKCLSKAYANNSTLMKWQCKEGHTWSATYGNISQGKWCPKCAKKNLADAQRGTIQRMQEYARAKGGKCLSKEYVTARRRLKWRCAEGHEWDATPTSITNKNCWCPTCAGRPALSLKDARRLATKRGGVCLSSKYINARSNLKWQCKEGHTWSAAFGSVRGGSWCPKCADKRTADCQRGNIEDMRSLAINRGGRCISEGYRNNRHKLTWECAQGHTWEAAPDNISAGKWCPECSSGISERICRTYFEAIFQENFPRSYPAWLKSKEGYRLELDGFCKKLGLAFEHQGRQHYEYSTYFHRGRNSFKEQQSRDKQKRELCKSKGVSLIEIPPLFDALNLDSLKEYILNSCRDLKVPIPKGALKQDIDLEPAYSGYDKDKFAELISIAEAKGGTCLSETYLGTRHKLLWKCGKGHEWYAMPETISSGSWCKVCAGLQRGTIEEMQAIAKSRGGKCLSEVYINARSIIEWECAEGHIWKARAAHVKRGSWCRKCSQSKRRARERKSRQ